jgi:hypothetical protein
MRNHTSTDQDRLFKHLSYYVPRKQQHLDDQSLELPNKEKVLLLAFYILLEHKWDNNLCFRNDCHILVLDFDYSLWNDILVAKINASSTTWAEPNEDMSVQMYTYCFWL